MNFKFPKSEKLRLKKDLERLFAEGTTAFKYPVSIRFLKFDGKGTNLCAVTVPKKRFKKAVDRNRLKRQMREAYRLNKHLISQENRHFHLMLVYSNNEKLAYRTIEKAVKFLLNKLNQ